MAINFILYRSHTTSVMISAIVLAAGKPKGWAGPRHSFQFEDARFSKHSRCDSRTSMNTIVVLDIIATKSNSAYQCRPLCSIRITRKG